MSSSRNYAIDWLKGLMIIVIFFLHTYQIPFLRHGNIVVDLFFFISGFYLMDGFVKKPTTAVRYTWSRVKRFYLPYIICFVVSCIIRYEGLLSFTDLDSFLDRYAKFAYYLTLSEEVGPKILEEHILDGSWFLSVLIIAGFLLYGLLEYNSNLAVKVLLPAICILGYTFIFTNSPNIMSWSRVGAISLPLLRGVCAMSAGIWMNSLWQDHQKAIERKATLINIGGLVAFLLFMSLMFAKKSFDVYVPVLMPWILLSAIITKSWLNTALQRTRGSLLTRVGQNTIYVLCAHPPVITVVWWVNENLLGNRLGVLAVLGIEAVGTIVATLLLMFVCKRIQKAR